MASPSSGTLWSFIIFIALLMTSPNLSWGWEWKETDRHDDIDQDKPGATPAAPEAPLGNDKPVAGDETKTTLRRAIERAVATHPVMGAARAGLAEFEGKLRGANLLWLPRIEGKGYTSITPSKTGNAVEGISTYDDWGPYFSFEISGILPLYTFGKLQHLKEMARAGVDVGQAQVQIARTQVELMVVEAWLSLQFAHHVEDILQEGEKYLERARNYLEKQRDEDADDYDDVDMLRLRVYESEVAGRRLDSARARLLALEALKLLTGLSQDSFAPPSRLSPFPSELAPLDSYQAQALEHRGELRALEAAVRAQQGKVALEKSQFFPDFFLGGFYSFSYSAVVEEQSSPFAYDPYNSWFAGAGLGIRFKLDFAERIANLDESEAGQRKLTSQRLALQQKVQMEVLKAYAECKDHLERIKLERQAYKAAQGWLIAKIDVYESGFSEMRDLADALGEFFKRRIAYEESIFQFNLSLTKLAGACGRSILELTKIE